MRSSPPQTPGSDLDMMTGYANESGDQHTPKTPYGKNALTSGYAGKYSRSLSDQIGYSSPVSNGFETARAMSRAPPLAQPVAINPMHQFNHLRQDSNEHELAYYSSPAPSTSSAESLSAIPEHFIMSEDMGGLPMGMITDAELLE